MSQNFPAPQVEPRLRNHSTEYTPLHTSIALVDELDLTAFADGVYPRGGCDARATERLATRLALVGVRAELAGSYLIVGASIGSNAHQALLGGARTLPKFRPMLFGG